MAAERPRILLAITVYNGREFVPRAIESAARLRDHPDYDLDVLLLDDASPEPGFSDELEGWCRDAGVECYRTPVNLGIPRNVNLGLLRAMDAGHDHVIIANSDVIFPANLIERLLAVVATDERIGSVTAWSNNVSMYSLPNDEPDLFLSDQGVVDWVSASLAGEFGTAAVDVPAGISFAILIPRRALMDVGLMDPVFGRGYCEETDWSLRSLAQGWRVVLAPSAFVYHQGQGSNVAAGLVAGGHSTVPENEAVIDLRYPLFRSQVQAFAGSDILPMAHKHAIRRLVRDGAAQYGWRLDLGWLAPMNDDGTVVRCTVEPAGDAPLVQVSFLGFHTELALDTEEPLQGLLEFFGGPPQDVGVGDRGELAARLFRELVGDVADGYRYPHRV
jgi:GT2 family glycosyltransferase